MCFVNLDGKLENPLSLIKPLVQLAPVSIDVMNNLVFSCDCKFINGFVLDYVHPLVCLHTM